jgi:hypothetical protein
MAEQIVPSDGSWSGIKAGPPPYWEGERPGKSYTKDISLENLRLEPVKGRITVRYYLPGQAIQSTLAMTQEKITLQIVDGGALLTTNDLPAQTTISARFTLVSTARPGQQVCNRAVLTLPGGVQHSYNLPCVTSGQ